MNTNQYVSLTKQLIDLLRTNGKNGPANFFQELCDRVDGCSDSDSLLALEELSKSGKITDLAAFSDLEEQAFDELFEEAGRLLDIRERGKGDAAQ